MSTVGENDTFTLNKRSATMITDKTGKSRDELLKNWQEACADLTKLEADPNASEDDIELAKDICYITFENYVQCPPGV